MRTAIVLTTIALLSACVAVPSDVKPQAPMFIAECSNIVHKKEIEIVSINDEENSGYYYSIAGVILAPITVSVSALISSIYAMAHNVGMTEEQVEQYENCLNSDLTKPAHLLSNTN